MGQDDPRGGAGKHLKRYGVFYAIAAIVVIALAVLPAVSGDDDDEDVATEDEETTTTTEDDEDETTTSTTEPADWPTLFNAIVSPLSEKRIESACAMPRV